MPLDCGRCEQIGWAVGEARCARAIVQQRAAQLAERAWRTDNAQVAEQQALGLLIGADIKGEVTEQLLLVA